MWWIFTVLISLSAATWANRVVLLPETWLQTRHINEGSRGTAPRISGDQDEFEEWAAGGQSVCSLLCRLTVHLSRLKVAVDYWAERVRGLTTTFVVCMPMCPWVWHLVQSALCFVFFVIEKPQKWMFHMRLWVNASPSYVLSSFILSFYFK